MRSSILHIARQVACARSACLVEIRTWAQADIHRDIRRVGTRNQGTSLPDDFERERVILVTGCHRR